MKILSTNLPFTTLTADCESLKHLNLTLSASTSPSTLLNLLCQFNFSSSTSTSTTHQNNTSSPSDSSPPTNCLDDSLGAWPSQELADLADWTVVLNIIDLTLHHSVFTDEAEIVLIPSTSPSAALTYPPLTSAIDAAFVKDNAIELITHILIFLKSLLKNSISKHIFASTNLLVHLLSAVSPTIATLALSTLTSLAPPPPMNHQPNPIDSNPHNTSLTLSHSAQVKLLDLCKGWGSRGQGLGLYQCCTSQNSKARLPDVGGLLRFDFYDDLNSKLVIISIPHVTLLTKSSAQNFKDIVANYNVPTSKHFQLLNLVRLAHSFTSLETRVQAVRSRLEALICVLNVYSNYDVIAGYFQGNPEVVGEIVDLIRPGGVRAVGLDDNGNGVGSSNGSSNGESNSSSNDNAVVPYKIKLLSLELLESLVAPRESPDAQFAPGLSSIARHVNIFQELGVTRSSSSSGGGGSGYNGVMMGLVSKEVNFLAGLGSQLEIPSSSSSSSSSASSSVLANGEDVVMTDEAGAVELASSSSSSSSTNSTINKHVHFGATSFQPPPSPPPSELNLIEQLNLTDQTFSLISAVIAIPQGGSAMTDCGIVPALLNIVEWSSYQRPSLASSSSSSASSSSSSSVATSDPPPPSITGKPLTTLNTPDTLHYKAWSLKQYISAQAVQILESLVASTPAALSIFIDLKGCETLVNRLDFEILESVCLGEEGMTQVVLRSRREEQEARDIKERAVAPVAPVAPAAVGDVAVAGGEGDVVGNAIRGAMSAVRRREGGTGSNAMRDSDDDDDDDDDDREFEGIFTNLRGPGALPLPLLPPASPSPPPPSPAKPSLRPLTAPRRAILFSIFNALTVMFHTLTQSNLIGVSLSSGPLTSILKDVLVNISQYGGVIAALTCTLMNEIMNSDPQCVKHVHSSGLATNFIEMLKSDNIPPSPELIMGLPNVLSALSLTESGAKVVLDANPFPSLLKLFYKPEYAMPNSRCLQGDMCNIVGSGLDEIIRHVPSLRVMCIEAFHSAVKDIVDIGEVLVSEEDGCCDERDVNKVEELAYRRTCVLQYVAAISQVLSEVMTKPEHVLPFLASPTSSAMADITTIDSDSTAELGMSKLLSMYALLLPSNRPFLANLSCMSNQSIAHIAHFSAASSLTVLIKALAQFDVCKSVSIIVGRINKQFVDIGLAEKEFFKTVPPTSTFSKNDNDNDNPPSRTHTHTHPADLILSAIPRAALHTLDPTDTALNSSLNVYASYLRSVCIVEYTCTLLGNILRGIGPRDDVRAILERLGSEIFDSINGNGEGFKGVVESLVDLNVGAQIGVCRVRTESVYKVNEIERTTITQSAKWHPVLYTLRIVNADGAVIRDGLEIDYCNNVGSYDMGSLVQTTDRVVNFSGVMRYKTERGWVSETTRGQGRETICEVIGVIAGRVDMTDDVVPVEGSRTGSRTGSGTETDADCVFSKPRGIEQGVHDLANVGANVLARLQVCTKLLLTYTSKLVVTSVKTSPTISTAFPAWSGKAIVLVANSLEKALKTGLDEVRGITGRVTGTTNTDVNVNVNVNIEVSYFSKVNSSSHENWIELTEGTSTASRLCMAGAAMYLGSVIETMSSCILDDRKKYANLLLLARMAGSDKGQEKSGSVGMYDALEYILLFGLNDMCHWAEEERNAVTSSLKVLSTSSTFDAANPPVLLASDTYHTRCGRASSASFIPALTFMKKLAATDNVMSCYMSVALERARGSASESGNVALLKEIEVCTREGHSLEADAAGAGADAGHDADGIGKSDSADVGTTSSTTTTTTTTNTSITVKVGGTTDGETTTALVPKKTASSSSSSSSSSSFTRVFKPEAFVRSLTHDLAKTTLKFWSDIRLTGLPAHILNIYFMVVSDLLVSLRGLSSTAAKPEKSFLRGFALGSPPARLADAAIAARMGGLGGVQSQFASLFGGRGELGIRRDGGGRGFAPGLADGLADEYRALRDDPDASDSLQQLMRGAVGAGRSTAERRNLLSAPVPARAPFAPSETVITQLGEMGFEREHVLEAMNATESNVPEVAMEYVLSHPPPSPMTISRRVAARAAAAARAVVVASESARDLRLQNEALQAEQTGLRAEFSVASASASAAAAAAVTPASTLAAARVAARATTHTAATADALAAAVNYFPPPPAPPPRAAAASTFATAMEGVEMEKKASSSSGLESTLVTAPPPPPPPARTEIDEILEVFEKSISGVCINLILSGSYGVRKGEVGTTTETELATKEDDGFGSGDGASEASTFVISAFLLEFTKFAEIHHATMAKNAAANAAAADVPTLSSCRNDLVSGLLDVFESHTSIALDKSKTVNHTFLNNVTHAIVILLRAFPKCRKLLLKRNLVGVVLSCIGRVRNGKIACNSPGGWPSWMTSFLLLLDIMAQSVSGAFSVEIEAEQKKAADAKKSAEAGGGEAGAQVVDNGDGVENSMMIDDATTESIEGVTSTKRSSSSKDKSKEKSKASHSHHKKERSQAEPKMKESELERVRKETEKHIKELVETKEKIFQAMLKDSGLPSAETEAAASSTAASSSSSSSSSATANKTAPATSASATSSSSSSTTKPAADAGVGVTGGVAGLLPLNVPSYHPLLPSREAERAMMECFELLTWRPTKSNVPPPPSTMHALLQLLARVLRSNKLATKFLKKGGCEAIVKLPKSCTFSGRTNLVTSIFRHVLEDPITLQTAMETEVRTAVNSLGKSKSSGGSGSAADKRVQAKVFVQHCTPLICRDPVVFLKAAAHSIELVRSVSSGELSRSPHGYVRLMSPNDRFRSSRALAKVFADDSASVSAGGEDSAVVQDAEGSNNNSTKKEKKDRNSSIPSAPSSSSADHSASTSSSETASAQAQGSNSQGSHGSKRMGEGGKNPSKRSRTSTGKVATSGSSSQDEASGSRFPHMKSDSKSESKDANFKGKDGQSPKRSKKGDGEAAAADVGAAVGSVKKQRESISESPSFVLNGTPANHITALLFTHLITTNEAHLSSLSSFAKTGVTMSKKKEKKNSLSLGFLSTCDLLDILANMVLALPSSAAAIHRYRAPSNSLLYKLKHALSGAADPPATAVSYLLHKLLPQQRAIDAQQAPPAGKASSLSNSASTSSSSDADADYKEKLQKDTATRVKTAQNSARLLVALCARAGEGRRRVVYDLACALKGKGTSKGEGSALWALQAWGELCIGLAAPRSGAVGTPNSSDSNSTLSWEVVRLMISHGVAHALMAALGRVDMSHPLAPAAAGALLRPLEIFTRSTVSDHLGSVDAAKANVAVKSMPIGLSGQASSGSGSDSGFGFSFGTGSAAGDGGGGEGGGGESCVSDRGTNHATFAQGSTPNHSPNRSGGENSEGVERRYSHGGPSQQGEGAFADDAMLDDGFDEHTATRIHRDNRNEELRDLVEGMMELEQANAEDGDDDDGEDDEDEDGEEGDFDEEEIDLDGLEEVSDDDEEGHGSSEDDDEEGESESNSDDDMSEESGSDSDSDRSHSSNSSGSSGNIMNHFASGSSNSESDSNSDSSSSSDTDSNASSVDFDGMEEEGDGEDDDESSDDEDGDDEDGNINRNPGEDIGDLIDDDGTSSDDEEEEREEYERQRRRRAQIHHGDIHGDPRDDDHLFDEGDEDLRQHGEEPFESEVGGGWMRIDANGDAIFNGGETAGAAARRHSAGGAVLQRQHSINNGSGGGGGGDRLPRFPGGSGMGVEAEAMINQILRGHRDLGEGVNEGLDYLSGNNMDMAAQLGAGGLFGIRGNGARGLPFDQLGLGLGGGRGAGAGAGQRPTAGSALPVTFDQITGSIPNVRQFNTPGAGSSGGGFSRSSDTSAMDAAYGVPLMIDQNHHASVNLLSSVSRNRAATSGDVIVRINDVQNLRRLGVSSAISDIDGVAADGIDPLSAGGGGGRRADRRPVLREDALAREGGGGGIGSVTAIYSGDTSLFPSGPAAGTHIRVTRNLHPLLSGITLPSASALSYWYAPHGLRGSSGNASEAPSRSGSGSGSETVLRLVSGPDGLPYLEQRSSGPASAGNSGSRWTDDGEPADTMMQTFSTAFESALGETIARSLMVTRSEGEVNFTSSSASSSSSSHPAVANLDRNARFAILPRRPVPASASDEVRNETESMSLEEEGAVADAAAAVDGADGASDVVPAPAAAPAAQAIDIASIVREALAATQAVHEATAALSVQADQVARRHAEVQEAMEDVNSARGAVLEAENRVMLDEVSAARDAVLDAEELALAPASPAVAQTPPPAEVVDETPPAAEASATQSPPVIDEVAESTPAVVSASGLVCPPGFDIDVFNSLPDFMQQEIVDENTTSPEDMVDEASGLDPEALAALPPDMRREIIAQEAEDRRARVAREANEAPANPDNAEEMDNASFIVSLTPELREDVLLTADDTFLASLPPDIAAEAQLLRERASASYRQQEEDAEARAQEREEAERNRETMQGQGRAASVPAAAGGGGEARSRNPANIRKDEERKKRIGKMKVDKDRESIVYDSSANGVFISSREMKVLLEFFFLLAPIRPQRLLQKVLQNICSNPPLRKSALAAMVSLISSHGESARTLLKNLDEEIGSEAKNKVKSALKTASGGGGGGEFGGPDDNDDDDDNGKENEKKTEDNDESAGNNDVGKNYDYLEGFPPSLLIGVSPDVVNDGGLTNSNYQAVSMRRSRAGAAAASIAANLPASARGMSDQKSLPPIVARRVIDTMLYLSKSMPSVARFLLQPTSAQSQEAIADSSNDMKITSMSTVEIVSSFEMLLDLLNLPLYSQSSTNLEQLLQLLETVAVPLALLPKVTDMAAVAAESEKKAAYYRKMEELELSLSPFDEAASSSQPSKNRVERACEDLMNDETVSEIERGIISGALEGNLETPCLPSLRSLLLDVKDIKAKERLADAVVVLKEKKSTSAWVEIPRPAISPERLRLLCGVLRLEACKESSFARVNVIAKRLCRIPENRSSLLAELAEVAQGLGADSISDLRSLEAQLRTAADEIEIERKEEDVKEMEWMGDGEAALKVKKSKKAATNIPASAFTLNSSSSELKLLRVLQTLGVLCNDSEDDGNERGHKRKEEEKKTDGTSAELIELLQKLNLDSMWNELSNCLRIVSVLEGVGSDTGDGGEGEGGEGEGDTTAEMDEEGNADDAADPNSTTKLSQSSSMAGLLTRFLPSIESFFLVNAASGEEALAGSGLVGVKDMEMIDIPHAFLRIDSVTGKQIVDEKFKSLQRLVGGERLVKFVTTHKVLLNALLRANPNLLDRSLSAMVKVAGCRPALAFDVKRNYFRSQLKKMKSSVRRFGSLRLAIRRNHVFEDSYHQLRLRTTDEMRGRIHITFHNEDGVDAGGLTREFYGILAREMFNPNYALFNTTHDGATYQPNQLSYVNPDHLLYFRFIGRIVGKAVADGMLLDCHFTRSFYKHMLGLNVDHHDMQSIDPDFYKNLKMILDYNLEDIGLELTMSAENDDYGKMKIVDLVEGGRRIAVTDANKAEYVTLICINRMTTAIKPQIDAFLAGFHELVKPELVSIFNSKELELLISGCPEIDMTDLKANTEYNGYKVSDVQIQWFWNCLFEMSKEDKVLFIQFVTGTSKVPLEGFSAIQGMRGPQKFNIHKAFGENQLPTAHTCFNQLDVPAYKSEEDLKAKLLMAIREASEGFGFA